ncbi:MAG: TVP38/TMEM64 family protein [Nitrospirota bacterium]
MRQNISRIASFVKFITLIAIIILCIFLYPRLSPQSIQAFIKENSAAVPLLFIAICTIKSVLFFLPSMGLTIIAGLLFGKVWGTLYVVIGGAFSTVVGFYFAQWIGRDAVEQLIKRYTLIKQIEEQSKEHGIKTVLLMRLFNLPWDMVSYWAGLSGISFKDFYIASLIPLVPVSFLYTYFGSKVFTPTSAGFIASLIIMFVMGAIPYIRLQWKKRTDD